MNIDKEVSGVKLTMTMDDNEVAALQRFFSGLVDNEIAESLGTDCDDDDVAVVSDFAGLIADELA